MPTDLIIILIVILIVVLVWRGPKTLPKLGEALGRERPGIGVHHRARPRPVPGDSTSRLQQLVERRRVDDRRRCAFVAHPSIAATLRNHSTSGGGR